MEYRGVQYTVAEDDFGWLWSVVLGSPPKIKSGHAVTKGTAILKVWTAIDRMLGLPKAHAGAIGPARDLILSRSDSRFRA
jgi:hypothetical protein